MDKNVRESIAADSRLPEGVEPDFSTYKIGRPDEKGTILDTDLDTAIRIAKRDKLSCIEDMETDKIVWEKGGK